MDKEEMAELLKMKDPVSHVDIIHLLEDGPCDVLFSDSALGVAVKHPCGTVYASPFTEDFMPLVDAIGDAALIDIEDERMARWYIERRKWCFKGECWTYRYEPEKGLKDEGPYRYRVMGESDWQTVREHYTMLSDEEVKRDLLSGRIHCIMDGTGTVMGFCGWHPEGSMGLLEIFPEYRRRGLGTCMESHIINETLRRGRVPFCNVYCSNGASEKLQLDLGLERGAILSWWVWPEA